MNRSTPLKRTPFKTKACTDGLGPARATVPLIKPKTCAKSKGGCGNRFTPARPLQAACCPSCAQSMAAKVLAKKAAQLQAEDKRQTRAQLEALKTIPQLKREAQQAFNAFIRARDRAAGYRCISSGKPLDWGTAGITGSRVDAGHYRSTGAADHLRFNEDNCHAQSVSENRDKAGNAVSYRIGLISRIGLVRVEALETNNAPVKWTREGLRQIICTYRAKTKAMEKAMREARELELA